jgi:hypothetical protein
VRPAQPDGSFTGSDAAIWPSVAALTEIERLQRLGWRICYCLATASALCFITLFALWIGSMGVLHH